MSDMDNHLKAQNFARYTKLCVVKMKLISQSYGNMLHCSWLGNSQYQQPASPLLVSSIQKIPMSSPKSAIFPLTVWGGIWTSSKLYIVTNNKLHRKTAP